MPPRHRSSARGPLLRTAALWLVPTVILAGCGGDRGNPIGPSPAAPPAAAVSQAASPARRSVTFVQPDQDDYAPGSVVTISGDNRDGAGYVAGNTVDVQVLGPNGWSASCSAIVAADGSWSCQITLDPDPEVAVGDYSFTATSTDVNGNLISESGTFTDANVNFNIANHGASPNPVDVNVQTTVSGDLRQQGSGAAINVAGIAGTVTIYNTAGCTGTVLSGPTNVSTNGSGQFSTNYTPTASGSQYVQIAFSTQVVGGDTYTQKNSPQCFLLTVNAANNPPTAEANGPYAGNEGSAIALSSAGSSDSDGTIVSYAWSYTVDSADAGASCSFSPNASAANPSITCTDDGSYTVKLKVTDDDGAESAEDTAALTVSNVNPVLDASGSWTVTQTNCSVNVSAAFTDAGTNDTHTATIDWGDGTITPGTVAEVSGSGTVSGSHVYSAIGSWDIEITVNDDDSGSDTKTLVGLNNAAAIAYPLPPIFTAHMRYNIGSTIPVKLYVTGCTLATFPEIHVKKVGNGDVDPVRSAGKSNIDEMLRYTPDLPGYIFNWKTKGLDSGDYEVTVNGTVPGGPYTTIVTLDR